MGRAVMVSDRGEVVEGGMMMVGRMLEAETIDGWVGRDELIGVSEAMMTEGSEGLSTRMIVVGGGAEE